MNCPDCKTSMIKTRATTHGDDYWYCRTCKKELSEIKTKDVPRRIEIPDDDYDDWQDCYKPKLQFNTYPSGKVDTVDVSSNPPVDSW